MENILSFIFPRLDADDRQLLGRMIRAQRVQVLKDMLAKAKSSNLARDIGEQGPGVVRFLADLVALSKKHPDQFWRIVDGWPVPFCLARLLYPDGGQSDGASGHIAGNLDAILILERLLGGAALETSSACTTSTDEEGRIPGLLRGLALKLRDERFHNRRVEWLCSQNEVTVRLPDAPQVEFSLPLPLEDNPLLQLTPLAGAEVLGVPILEEATIFGEAVDRLSVAQGMISDRQSDWTPRGLHSSLTSAVEMLAKLWPEALEWVQVIVPGFVDMGTPPNRVRMSTSYEPGSPIFMGRVDNDFFHAEDLVHEIQHQRLFLSLGGPTHFKTWEDLRQAYVSPYRPDPRHLRGVVVGLHAFLTVNELRRRRIVQEPPDCEAFLLEMAELHYENLFAFRTALELEEFGALGRELFKQMAETIAEHHRLIDSASIPRTPGFFTDRIAAHTARVLKSATGGGENLRNTSPIYMNWDETARLAASFS